jgi:hypothetical protein
MITFLFLYLFQNIATHKTINGKRNTLEKTVPMRTNILTSPFIFIGTSVNKIFANKKNIPTKILVSNFKIYFSLIHHFFSL